MLILLVFDESTYEKVNITIITFLKERNFCVNLFSRAIFVNILREFNFANWLLIGFSRGFIFVNLSFINVSYILTFSWFVLQLVVYELRNSFPNFSIFQITLFGYKRLNSRLNASEVIKRSRHNKKFYIFLSMLPLLTLFDILWNIFDMTIVSWSRI